MLQLAIGIVLATAATAEATPPDLEERIRCQQAIETVYERHRTGSPGSRAIAAAVVRRKAMDGVLKTAALERFWGVTLTGPQLQAELERMSSHSRAPGVLRELWAALHDDPRLAAECLARPALADRKIRTYYAFDERRHGALEERARLGKGGVRTETEWRRGGPTAAARDRHVLDAGAFDARVREVRREVGGVREDETRFYVVSVLALEPDRVRIATVEWRKEPFDAWWGRTRATLPLDLDPPLYRFARPQAASAAPCADDTWRPTLDLLDPRYWHTAVWTGSEMIVFGGMQSVGTYYDDGTRYDPATDTWTRLPDAGAPSARQAHVAVWTGSEMIVWGSTFDRSGALYDPSTDAWRPMSVANAPVGRSDASAVWTGTEMIVWGGEMVNSGGRYNPATDTWTPLPAAPLAPRAYHTAVWTGTQMIVWGGYNPHIGQMYGDGARYDPGTNAWSMVTPQGAPNMRYWHTAVWTGSEMIVWGGINYPVYDLSGGRYDPVADTWTPTSMVNAPSLRWMHMAVWTGTDMIVQGGTPGAAVGGRYRPGTDTWTPTNPVNAANNGQGITAVWTGTEMIVWGGLDDDFVFHNDGARYNPATDTWLRTTTMNVPQARGLHAAVWTGAEMMVWGGNVGDNAGGIYDPATDTWRTTSTTGAPYSRQNASGVWTGQEAIFWGGGQSWDPGTGGRYDVAADTWAETSLVNAANDRYGHTAIWTGTEMIVFGGIGTDNVAKRYRPDTDTWTDATTANAPGERDHHAAVWTGTEMIIWGGFINAGITPTGGRYRPDTDTWTPTNVTASPVTRMWPVGVWTGTEMIVWGGYDWLWLGDLGDGARYRPADDTWTVTTPAGAPTPRIAQGVWTGSEMLLWGGANDSSGGRYDPASDSWRPTTLTNAPDVRAGGRWSTVWTGSEMIIWGGIIETQEGSRYCALPLVPTPDITITPGAVNFGAVLVGQQADRTLTVRNDGNAPLVIASVAPPPAPFAIVTDACTGTTLPPSAGCAVLVRFVPPSTGSFAGQIAVTSNDPDEPSVTVPLQGTGAVLALEAASLSVLDASGNGVWEPGETTAVVTSWRNTGVLAAPSVTGTATASAPVALVDGTAVYGPIAAGATVSCAQGDCYDASATGPRPAAHWDAVLSETLGSGQTHDWTLHVGGSFADVGATSPFYRFVETVLHRNVTGGCTATGYCPSASTTREQMAVFVLVAKEGPGFVPPACQPGQERFSDVPASSPFCRWIEELARRGVVSGCTSASYCPTAVVTREQMAVFLLRVLDPALDPPACTTPMFGDVPASSPFCRWVEELARRGTTSGCSADPLLYCPTAAVTRGQMAVFCTVAFGLQLYVP